MKERGRWSTDMDRERFFVETKTTSPHCKAFEKISDLASTKIPEEDSASAELFTCKFED